MIRKVNSKSVADFVADLLGFHGNTCSREQEDTCAVRERGHDVAGSHLHGWSTVLRNSPDTKRP